MQKIRQIHPVLIAAYGSAALYVLSYLSLIVFHRINPLLLLVCLLLLFPVVALSPAASWAQAGGYGFCVLGIVVTILGVTLFAQPVMPGLQLSVCVVGTVWFTPVSFKMRGAAKVLCLDFTLTLMGSLLCFFAPYYIQLLWVMGQYLLLFASLMFPMWLILVAQEAARNNISNAQLARLLNGIHW